jgi:uncharacterized protein (TIRG00374 family)
VKRRYAIAGFILSLLLIGLLVRGIEWGQVRQSFVDVKLEWLGIISAIVVLRTGIHAWRWTFLLRSVHPLGLGLCFRATSVGFLYSNLLPAYAGTVVRAFVAGEGGRVPVSSVFATIVVERLIGILLLLPLMALLALGWVNPPNLNLATKASLQVGVGLSGAIVLLVGLVLWGLVRARERTLARLHKTFSFLPSGWGEKISGWAENFVTGLRGMPTGRNLVAFAVLSVSMWGCWFAGNFFIFRAFDLPLPLSAALMLMLLQYLSFTLPTGPGLLGSYHLFATMGGLLLYGITSAQALSAAVVLRITISVTAVLLGLCCLIVEALLAGRPLKSVALFKPTSHRVIKGANASHGGK